nr:restriction endonuclease subunit S [uncultured Mogibacterium sp.]
MLIHRNIEQLIEYVDERNTDGAINDFYGINIQKEFMPTLANTDGIDPRKYKVVRENRFVFSGMQTGRDKCIRIGLYKGDPIIVSPAYTTFEISATNEVLPDYFFMLFLSNEMDRYGWFISDSSIRANLDLERFNEIEFDLPDMSIQRKYVDIYNAIKRVQKLNTRIKDICPVLIRSSIQEARS